MTSNLSALIERVERLDGPDQSLDAEICIELQYGGINSEGACNVRTDPDWEGDLLFEIEGDEHPDCCNPIPALTASIDAAVALVDRVLPGHGYTTDHQPVYGNHHDASVFNDHVITIGNGRGPNGAIAICLAALRALQNKDRQ